MTINDKKMVQLEEWPLTRLVQFEKTIKYLEFIIINVGC